MSSLLLPYDTIIKAHEGDPIAIQAVLDLTLADWAQQRRDYTAARAAYQNVLTLEPTNADAILGLTEVDIAAGDTAAARSQLAKLPATDNASLNTQRRVALAQAQLGDTAAAQRTFNKLIPQAKSQPPSMESAMVLDRKSVV